jgi:hypothetical protein
MKTLKILPVILLSALVMISCEETDYTYDGPPVAEFAARSTSSTYTSAYSVSIKQANYIESLDTLELVVNLVGAHQTKDLTLEYSLVTDTVKNFPLTDYFIAPSTAVEGTHFNFVPVRTGTGNGLVTIPANTSTGIIKLNSIAAQVSPDVSKRVVIKLHSTPDLIVNPNYQYFIVTITRL